MPQQRLVAERRWRLGVQSRGHPSAIVAELLRALRASQVGNEEHGRARDEWSNSWAPCLPAGANWTRRATLLAHMM